MTYRETFTAGNHGDAVKAMYSRFEAAFGVSRRTLQAEVMRDRREHAKEYRKLRRELISRATKRELAGNQKPVAVSAKVHGKKKSDQCAPKRDELKEQVTLCPTCRKQFRTALIPRHNSGGRRCRGRKKPGIEPPIGSYSSITTA